MSYRTRELPWNPARAGGRVPGEQHCAICMKLLNEEAEFRWIHLVDGGAILHPEDEPKYTPDGGNMDFFPVGPDCAKRLGLEWSRPK